MHFITGNQILEHHVGSGTGDYPLCTAVVLIGQALRTVIGAALHYQASSCCIVKFYD